MPITSTATGTTYEGPIATEIYRYETFIRALTLEGRTPGMRLTRGPSALARAKRITGLRTNNRHAHIDWFRTEIESLRTKDAKSTKAAE